MALLFMDGFDAGDYALKWQVGGGTHGTSAGTRFSSGRSMYIWNSNGYILQRFSAASQIFVGFAMYQDPSPSPVNPFVTLLGDSATTNHISLRFSNSTTLQLLLGGASVLASATVTQRISWGNYFEVGTTIADAGGHCVVKVNGVTVIDFTGDTKNGGTNTTIDAIALGDYGAYNQVSYFDDVYICDGTGSAPHDTFLGDVRVYAMSPAGAGASTQFTPSSGANYTTVDELPYSATDYNSSSTTGNRDTYAMADLPAGTANVYGVQTNVIAKKSDAGAMSLKPVVRSGATNYYGSATVLTSSDIVITDVRSQDPNTSAAWTPTGVNALEAGMEVA